MIDLDSPDEESDEIEDYRPPGHSHLTRIGIPLLTISVFSFLQLIMGATLSIFLVTLVPLALISFLYLVLSSDIQESERYLQSALTSFRIILDARLAESQEMVKKELEDRLPEIKFIKGKQVVETEFVEAVSRPTSRIVTIGSKSRMEPYLRAIEWRVSNEDVEYWRLLAGPELSKSIVTHLNRVIERPNVHVVLGSKDYLPFLLMTATNRGCVLGFRRFMSVFWFAVFSARPRRGAAGGWLRGCRVLGT